MIAAAFLVYACLLWGKTMEVIDSTPLGFSDLNDDEAFVISIFRHWQYTGSACKAEENSMMTLLKNDRLYAGLKPLLKFFETLPEQHRSRQKNDSAVLNPIEESILDEIGSVKTGQERCVKAFQRVLNATDTITRPASEIPRSGHDRLVELIDRKAAAVIGALYPGFWGTDHSPG